MNTSQTWVNAIRAFEPAYDELKYMLDQGPNIVAKLSHRGKFWCVSLEEDTSHDGSTKLDERVRWAKEQLEDWPATSRMAWHMWYFGYRRDAEKFITLYNLRWA